MNYSIARRIQSLGNFKTNTIIKRIYTFPFLIIVLFSGCIKSKSLPDPLMAGWNNQPVCEVLEDNSKLRVLRCTFPPGIGHERHYHDPHFGYAIAGSKFRITDTTGTREVDVPTGFSFSNKDIAWHEVLNIGDSTGVFLIIEPK